MNNSGHAELYLFASGNIILWKFHSFKKGLSLVLKFFCFCFSWDYDHWSRRHYYKYVENERIEKCKGHMMEPKKVTIHKRKIQDRKRKSVSGVVNAYFKTTLRRKYVLIQKLIWDMCNVILIQRHILVINLLEFSH